MKLPTTAKQIKGSKDYCDIDGTIYTYRSNYKGVKTNKLIKKAARLNKKHGYLYVSIYYYDIKYVRTRRLNRVVAETFIPNPDNLPVVGHKNNIKTDNRVENLYWTTYSENSQKAVNDGLLVNDKGFDDSQSKPVSMYDTLTNELLGTYGSIIEANKATGVAKTTIARQAKYHRPVRKPFYFRYVDDKTTVVNKIIGMFDRETDKLLGTYFSPANAAKETGYSAKTISQQLQRGRKQRGTDKQCLDIYFMFLVDKCEQTTETFKE